MQLRVSDDIILASELLKISPDFVPCCLGPFFSLDKATNEERNKTEQFACPVLDLRNIFEALWALCCYVRTSFFEGSKPSSGILRRVLLVRTDVSEERVASIFRVREKHEKFARAKPLRTVTSL
jgi:hypothetical protein